MPAETASSIRQILSEVALAVARELSSVVVAATSAVGLFDEVERAFDARADRLLVIWPRILRLRPEHGLAALGDLESGCDVVLGPVIDGGLYMLGLARPLSTLAALPAEAWLTADAMELATAAARDHQFTIGVLRAERGLATPADVRAALADPLLPARVAAALSSRS